jgi:hypothetical protein
METEKNAFDAVRAMMLENFEMAAGATQTYVDMVEKTMRAFPGANEDQIGTFTAYIEQQVAANRHFGEKLLRAKGFQEAFGIQAEYLQYQLRGCAEHAIQMGLAGSIKTFIPLSNYLGERIEPRKIIARSP